MIFPIAQVVRGIVLLRGATDNTLIGNTSDRLRVENQQSQVPTLVTPTTFSKTASVNGASTSSFSLPVSANAFLKQVVFGGTQNAAFALSKYTAATTQFVTSGDFESAGDVTAWANSGSGTGLTTTTYAVSTAQKFTGNSSNLVTYATSSNANRAAIRYTYGTSQNFLLWKNITAQFYNIRPTGGGVTRTISLIVGSDSGSITFSVSAVNTSGVAPFGTTGWVQVGGDLITPTSSTGTFDQANVTYVELAFIDSANRSGTAYWDTVLLTGALLPVFPALYSPANTSLDITLDPSVPLTAGDTLLLTMHNLNGLAAGNFSFSGTGVPR